MSLSIERRLPHKNEIQSQACTFNDLPSCEVQGLADKAEGNILAG